MNGNPFNDAAALRNSSFHRVESGRLRPIDFSAYSDNPFLLDAYLAFQNLIRQPDFSCVGAKAALNDESVGFAVYGELGSAETTAGLARDLFHFTQTEMIEQNDYATFMAVFRGPAEMSELDFERRLWCQLGQLHNLDGAHFAWDPTVSSDPAAPEFSFSFGERAFYVIGMHSNSSRAARRFPWPALVFNPHEQFERLRTDGKWKRMQETIRAREVALQGNINPMLSDFGVKSEARQYSGREVPKGWQPPLGNGEGKCPFAH